MIRFGLGDLTAEDFRGVEARFWAYEQYWPKSSGTTWARYIAPLAMQTFTRKLVFIRSFTTLKHVGLETRHGVLDLVGGEVKQSLRGITAYDGDNYYSRCTSFNFVYSQELKTMVEYAYQQLYVTLRRRVTKYGWAKTQYWLRKGTDGQV